MTIPHTSGPMLRNPLLIVLGLALAVAPARSDTPGEPLARQGERAPARAETPAEALTRRLAEAALPAAMSEAHRALVREWLRDLPEATLSPSESAALVMGSEVVENSGAWSLDHPPVKERHTAVYDPLRDRMIVFGGFGVSGQSGGVLNDVWTLSLGDAEWQPLAVAGAAPAERYGASAIYDPTRDRIVVFGGHSNGGAPFADTWALDLSGTPTWSPLMTSGAAPPARSQHTAVYEPTRDHMVIFGGLDSGEQERSDVWVLSFGDTMPWRQVLTSGAPPAVRRGHVAVHDPARGRIVVFGGYNGKALELQDVWTLVVDTLATWTPLAPGGTRPAVRRGAAGAWDPSGDRMVVFGGANQQGTLRDAWQLAFASGSPVWSPIPGGPLLPAKRQGHSMVLDAARNRMVIYGGRDTIGIMPSFSGPFRGDAWALPLAGSPAWVPLPELMRNGHAGAYDPIRDRAVIHGGHDGVSFLGDVWAVPLDGAHAAPIATSGAPPTPRQQHAAAYDFLRDRLLLFGGRLSSTTWSGELWSLSFATPTPQWTLLAPAGTPPEPREGMTMVHDAAADRLLLFGGYRKIGTTHQFFNDVWSLALGTLTWSKLTPSGIAPVARRNHAMALDLLRNRLIVHGGESANATLRSDVAALTLGPIPAWSTLAATGSAPTLSGHSLVYDRPRDRVVAHGGWGGLGSTRAYSDQAHALTLAGTPAWSTLTPEAAGLPRPRTEHVGLYDQRRDRMMAFGGYGSWNSTLSCYDDTWYLVWGTPTVGVGEGAPAGARIALAPPAPNPARASCRVEWSLAAAGRVRLEVVDLAGRRVRTLADGAFAAGRHDARWDGRDDDGRAVPAGLYFIRLEAAGESSSRRVAWMR